MEMFGLGKRELEEKFTKSELVLLAWRSQEVSASLEKGAPTGAPAGTYRKMTDAQVPEGLPDHFYNEQGEVDLRKVTGAEAYRYFSSVGIKLPIFGR